MKYFVHIREFVFVKVECQNLTVCEGDVIAFINDDDEQHVVWVADSCSHLLRLNVPFSKQSYYYFKLFSICFRKGDKWEYCVPTVSCASYIDVIDPMYPFMSLRISTVPLSSHPTTSVRNDKKAISEITAFVYAAANVNVDNLSLSFKHNQTSFFCLIRTRFLLFADV